MLRAGPYHDHTHQLPEPPAQLPEPLAAATPALSQKSARVRFHKRFARNRAATLASVHDPEWSPRRRESHDLELCMLFLALAAAAWLVLEAGARAGWL